MKILQTTFVMVLLLLLLLFTSCTKNENIDVPFEEDLAASIISDIYALENQIFTNDYERISEAVQTLDKSTDFYDFYVNKLGVDQSC